MQMVLEFMIELSTHVQFGGYNIHLVALNKIH